MAHQSPQGNSNNSSERPFSFQPTLDTFSNPPAAPHDQQQQSNRQHHSSSNGDTNHIPPDEHSWSGYPQQRFSYVDTPIDDNTQTFDDERTEALLREARERYGDGNTNSNQPAPQQQSQSQAHPLPTDPSQYPPEKPAVERMPSAYQLAPPAEPHPALSAPVSTNTPNGHPSIPPNPTYSPQQQPVHPAYQVGVQPSVSPGPLPLKNESDFKRPDRSSLPPLQSPHFDPPPKTSSPAPFSPYAATGPDLDTQHRPGQIPHPSMKHSKTGDMPQASARSHPGFYHGLCACPGSDLSTCFLGLTCPCILYSRLTYRLGQRSRKQDPTDLLGFHKCNGHCFGFAALCTCGVSGLLAAITRGRVRHAYEVEGSVSEDFIEGCCCCCCAVIQSEREIRRREEEKGRWAGPAAGINIDPYSRVQSMRYSTANGRQS